LLELGGFQPFSTTDWPGRLCAVAFVQGCPWRCGYCHNPGLQTRQRAPGAPRWDEALALLAQRVGLLDGVVFSGGEPTLDPALPDAIDDVRAMGFAVGLHTAGIYPRRLQALLPRLDWIGLDLKADAHGYAALTGAPESGHAAAQALQLVADSGLPFELRTTYDRGWLGDDALLAMGAQLRAHGVRHWVLQRQRRPVDGCAGSWTTAAAAPAEVSAHLRHSGLSLEWR
jgi:pyruvate formate lyase activating enzyme